MRKIRFDRLTKRSRNARVFSWTERTGELLGVTRKNGELVAIVVPTSHELARIITEDYSLEEILKVLEENENNKVHSIEEDVDTTETTSSEE